MTDILVGMLVLGSFRAIALEKTVAADTTAQSPTFTLGRFESTLAQEEPVSFWYPYFPMEQGSVLLRAQAGAFARQPARLERDLGQVTPPMDYDCHERQVRTGED